MNQHNSNPVLRKIGYPIGGTSFPTNECCFSEEEFRIARKNKVASSLVQRCNTPESGNPDYVQERLEYMDRVRKTLDTLSGKIGDSENFALVKSSLPFWVDASDIDVLAFDEDSIQTLQDKLDDSGYTIKGQSPTAVGALDPDTGIEIDAQTNFSAQHVTYFNSATLAADIEHRDVYGSTLPCVSLPRDLALIVVHSITEQMFIMKEYFAATSILQRLSKGNLQTFQSVIRENHAEPAVTAFFSIVSAISEEIFETSMPYHSWFEDSYDISQHRERDRLIENDYRLPHNFSATTFFEFCVYKMRNPLFRNTAMRQMVDFLDPRALKYFISKVHERRTREHYAHEYDDN